MSSFLKLDRECYWAQSSAVLENFSVKKKKKPWQPIVQSKASVSAEQLRRTCRCHVQSLSHSHMWNAIPDRGKLSSQQEALHWTASYKGRDEASWRNQGLQAPRSQRQQVSHPPTTWLELLWRHWKDSAVTSELTVYTGKAHRKGDPVWRVFLSWVGWSAKRISCITKL